MGRFYIRRSLRIWPLYFFCVFFGFVVFPFLKSTLGQVPNETANPIYYLFFLNNFDFIANGVPDSSVLGVLWSIAVEEQFYLIWPLLFLLLPKRFYPFLFAGVILLSILFRWQFDIRPYHEMHTLSCIGDMAIGAWGAYMAFDGRLIRKIENCPKWLILFLYVLVGLIFFYRDEAYQLAWWRPFERAAIALVFLTVILEQTYAKNSLFKMSNFPLLSRLGKISYGLYCLHFIGILVTLTITRKLGFNTELYQVLGLESLVGLILTIGIAAFSYRFYELPFLRLKEKFSFIRKD